MNYQQMMTPNALMTPQTGPTPDGIMYANGATPGAAHGMHPFDKSAHPNVQPGGMSGMFDQRLGQALQGNQWGLNPAGVKDAYSQFNGGLQDWRENGHDGARPTFLNYLFPNGAPQGFPQMGHGFQRPAGGMAAINNAVPTPEELRAQGGMMHPGMQQPQMMPPQQMPPMMPPQQVGTGLGVSGVLPPTSPFGLPGYGG